MAYSKERRDETKSFKDTVAAKQEEIKLATSDGITPDTLSAGDYGRFINIKNELLKKSLDATNEFKSDEIKIDFNNPILKAGRDKILSSAKQMMK